MQLYLHVSICIFNCTCLQKQRGTMLTSIPACFGRHPSRRRSPSQRRPCHEIHSFLYFRLREIFRPTTGKLAAILNGVCCLGSCAFHRVHSPESMEEETFERRLNVRSWTTYIEDIVELRREVRSIEVIIKQDWIKYKTFRKKSNIDDMGQLLLI